jgi:hypothetical protein
LPQPLAVEIRQTRLSTVRTVSSATVSDIRETLLEVPRR